MPSLGADMDEGTLLEWLVRPGDPVSAGEVVAVVDTAKSAVEVEAFESGVMGEQLVAPGTKVPVGTPLARIVPAGAPVGAVPTAERVAGPAAPPPVPAARPSVAAPPVVAPRVARPPVPDGVPVTVPVEVAAPVTPLVRHRAAELGVDLATVHGSGPHGRVTRADVEGVAQTTATELSPAPAPAGRPWEAAPGIPAELARPRVSPYARRLATELGVDLARLAPGPDGRISAADVRAASTAAAAPAPVAAQPIPAPAMPGTPEPPPAPAPSPDRQTAAATDPMRLAIARLMARSNAEIPHYHLETTVDLADALAWMHARNRELEVAQRLVPAALVLRAVARAAAKHPELNGFWVDDAFQPGSGVHLGVAISLRGGGLVAPAIHDADRLGVVELMAALRDLVGRARARRLRRAELADPTLTVTNLGEQGVEVVHGVIYPPQVALVGVGRVLERPWAVDGMLGVRPTVRISLAADHRATDGFVGSRFLVDVDRLLHAPDEP